LIVGTGEGQCHIIEISKVKSENGDSIENVITKTVTIPVPVNVSRILIADIGIYLYNINNHLYILYMLHMNI